MSGGSLQEWLILWHVRGVGPALYNRFLMEIGTPEQILRASGSVLRACGASQQVIEGIKNASESPIQADLGWSNDKNHHILTLSDPRYPERLSDIANAPPILYVNGNPDILNDPQLAMVGSRNPTAGGRETAYGFAAAFSKAGLCITSGLAQGIDAECHRAAVENDAPTIAVAATGLDRVYPSKNRDLARKIVKKGAIVSEFPVGTTPRAEYFPRRNRILSGLTLGTLVVEAALRSGSLITARYAMEQGREVFAIPGSIHNPLTKGCHQLIRQGARLVETLDDVLQEIASQIELNPVSESLPNTRETAQSVDKLDSEQQRLYDVLGYDPEPIDMLVEKTGLTAEAVSSMLLIMELEGYVASEGSRYHRTTGLNHP